MSVPPEPVSRPLDKIYFDIYLNCRRPPSCRCTPALHYRRMYVTTNIQPHMIVSRNDMFRNKTGSNSLDCTYHTRNMVLHVSLLYV